MGVITITKDNFKEHLLSADKSVIIDFWAPWCRPCRAMAPVMDEVADEVDDNVIVAKVNVEEEPELASQFHVTSIPMLAVIKNGKLTATAVGLRPKEEILALLEEE